MKQTIREILKFLSGAQTFHVLVHTWFQIYGQFPLKFFFVTITETFNAWAVFYNAIILAILIYFAYFYKRNKNRIK